MQLPVEIDLIHKGIKTPRQLPPLPPLVEIDLIHKGIKTIHVLAPLRFSSLLVEIDLIHKGIKTRGLAPFFGGRFNGRNRPDS